ncbi:MAG: hypothetical protein PHI12_03030 [Dehalococcoidales bacterium]|nr:hypothetical protein [Dehalococcoidales bacterium]
MAQRWCYRSNSRRYRHTAGVSMAAKEIIIELPFQPGQNYGTNRVREIRRAPTC